MRDREDRGQARVEETYRPSQAITIAEFVVSIYRETGFALSAQVWSRQNHRGIIENEDLFIYSSPYTLFLSLFIHLSMYLSIYLSICPPIYLPIYLPFHSSVRY